MTFNGGKLQAGVTTWTAGATIAAGEAVYFNETTGEVELAIADSTAPEKADNFIGFAAEAGTDGNPIKVFTGMGLPVTSRTGMTANTVYWLSDATPGSIQTAAPADQADPAVVVGIADAAAELMLQNIPAA